MMKKLSFSLAAMLGAASSLGATDCGQVIRDPGFDVWCGESLCSWKLLRGEIEQVGTWHDEDSGVAFLGEDTAIQQIAPVNSLDGVCIKFSMVANVPVNAEAFLHLDIEADGTIERSERIPTTDWAKIELLIHVAPPYDGIRFELAKTGIGEAVFANIGAELSDQCAGIPQIDAGPRPLGAGCSDLVACESELCVTSQTQIPPASPFGRVCAECDPELGVDACTGGEVCGIGAPLSPVLAVPMACVPPGSAVLAEQCLSDAECASGMCLRATGAPGVCSACKTTTDCGGAACGPSYLAGGRGPNVCRPGEGAGTTGTACGSDADCASGTCSGTDHRVCDGDGRPCSNDLGCPTGVDLIPGTCNTVGIQGGTCT